MEVVQTITITTEKTLMTRKNHTTNLTELLLQCVAQLASMLSVPE